MLTGEGADELFAGYDYLREFTEADDLHAELERTVRSLHNLNLQRCDRVTMAHGLEARVPFLDREVIALGAAPAARGQARRAGRARRSSCCARRSTAGCPTSCCGARRRSSATAAARATCSRAAVEADISDAEFEAERGAVEPPLRTKEELAYYRVLREHLQGVSAERTCRRFARA